jgi:Raf kinase inhibitor-like YbhB/YbcL family protein
MAKLSAKILCSVLRLLMKHIRLFLSVLFLILMVVPAQAQKSADIGIDTKFYYRISSVSESTPNDPRHLTVFGNDQKLILAQTIQSPGQLWKIEDVTIERGDHVPGYPIVRFTNRLVKDKSLDITGKGLPFRLALSKTAKDKTLKHETLSFPRILSQSWAVAPSPEPGANGMFILTNIEGIALQATRNEDVDQRLIVGVPSGTDVKPYVWVLSKTDVPIDEEFELTSTAFKDGARIPFEHTGAGANISPPLAWKGAPAGTKSFMLICTDPDAPSPANPDPNPFIHWFVLNIPATTKYLLAGVPRLEQLSTPFGATQFSNGFDEIGYSGPMPPKGSGKHRYIFTIFAMDRVHVLDPNLAPEAFEKILESSVLAKAELIGNYEIFAASIQSSRVLWKQGQSVFGKSESTVAQRHLSLLLKLI